MKYPDELSPAIIEKLGKGHNHAIKGKDLAGMLGMKGTRTLRQRINTLRRRQQRKDSLRRSAFLPSCHGKRLQRLGRGGHY